MNKSHTTKITKRTQAINTSLRLKPYYYSQIAAKVAPHLEPINYDRWSDLHWKAQLEGDLTAPEAQEHAAFESANMATIEKVYQRLRNDKEIQAHIEKIKAHPWVRVVE
ncbi:MAG: hypothetical protein IBX40_12615, partial [Methanosarcinales archaeon]|nr:hypothetical protein [Methanosarcinales archaeon]